MEADQKRVLVVDDDRDLARTMRIYFEKFGLEARVAENGPAALCEINVIPPDVIILDVSMPFMDGVEVCKFLSFRKRSHNIPIIVITGHHDEEIKRDVLKAGADIYLTKPLDIAELLQYVRESIAPDNQSKRKS